MRAPDRRSGGRCARTLAGPAPVLHHLRRLVLVLAPSGPPAGGDSGPGCPPAGFQNDSPRPMPCAPAWPSNSGRWSAKVMSCPWWPTGAWPCSPASTSPQLAQPSGLKPLGMCLAVFLPEQVERDTLPPHLLFNLCTGRNFARRRRLWTRPPSIWAHKNGRLPGQLSEYRVPGVTIT